MGGVSVIAGQHFRDMARLDLRALALEFAGHVHQAAEGSPASRSSAPVASMLLVFFSTMALEIFGIFDAEGAAEAAAGIGIRKFGQRESFDRRQERARLEPDTQFAQARAGIMIGGAGIELRLHRRHPRSSARKGNEFGTLAGKGCRAAFPFRIAPEETRIMLLQHAAQEPEGATT